jgi:hypothetical protein
MSLTSLIKTGMTEREWQLAWEKLPSKAKTLDLGITFEEWKEAVIEEGKNRRFIIYAVTGKRCSLRKGVKTVISEIDEDYGHALGTAVSA